MHVFFDETSTLEVSLRFDGARPPGERLREFIRGSGAAEGSHGPLFAMALAAEDPEWEASSVGAGATGHEIETFSECKLAGKLGMRFAGLL